MVGPPDAFDVRQQHGDDHGDDAEQHAGREEQRRRILEEAPSRSRGPAALSAIIRSEKRISALKAARIVPR